LHRLRSLVPIALVFGSLVLQRHERGTFTGRQPARLSRRQTAQFDWSKSDTHEALDPESKRRAEPPHLAFASLGNRHLELPPVAPQLPNRDALRLHRSVVELHALASFVHDLVGFAGDR